MKKMGVVSIMIFLFSISIFLYSFFSVNKEALSGGMMIFLAVVLPIFGLLAAFLSEKGALKVVGIAGNSVVLLVSVIIPVVSTLFWNQP